MKDLLPTLHSIGFGVIGGIFTLGGAWARNRAKNKQQDVDIVDLKIQQKTICEKIDTNHGELEKRLDNHDVKIGVGDANMRGVSNRLTSIESILLTIQQTLMDRGKS